MLEDKETGGEKEISKSKIFYMALCNGLGGIEAAGRIVSCDERLSLGSLR